MPKSRKTGRAGKVRGAATGKTARSGRYGRTDSTRVKDAGRTSKRKVSLTLDDSLLEEVRAMAAGAPLSGVVNDLLLRALEQERLRELVDELIAEMGEPPPEAYQRVLDQWAEGARQ